jgi:hypothetical protein
LPLIQAAATPLIASAIAGPGKTVTAVTFYDVTSGTPFELTPATAPGLEFLWPVNNAAQGMHVYTAVADVRFKGDLKTTWTMSATTASTADALEILVDPVIVVENEPPIAGDDRGLDVHRGYGEAGVLRVEGIHRCGSRLWIQVALFDESTPGVVLEVDAGHSQHDVLETLRGYELTGVPLEIIKVTHCRAI